MLGKENACENFANQGKNVSLKRTFYCFPFELMIIALFLIMFLTLKHNNIFGPTK